MCSKYTRLVRCRQLYPVLLLGGVQRLQLDALQQVCEGCSSLSCQASYALVSEVATSTCQHRLAESLPMIALHCTAGVLPSRLISSCPEIQWMQQWPNALPQIHV